ncbi:SsrA-binding protein SmpB [Pajaroellobacter abortibovis]|uniref:SsrA-binding protein n=1 Tax=Pajaroellobacter abortibovis TaxID=1882918 RepID=A0A1L6MYB3_9BACT|nr:SsrA-binding protein SmpB [Pajaroellobacter abortibovis]APS00499.1 SsrA-binding protein [Pajaroellobacter abortibovis]
MHCPSKTKSGDELIVKNRRAGFDYEIEDTYEGGLALVGSEVRSLRVGTVHLTDAFATIEGGEVWLKQLHIDPFALAKAFPHTPQRVRKILLHKHEIMRMERMITRRGYTLIPVKLYFKGGRAKVELAVARGKKNVDKRMTILRREVDRETRASLRRAQKGG